MDQETARRTVNNRFIGKNDPAFEEAVITLHKAGKSIPLSGTILNSPQGEIEITDSSVFGVESIHGVIWVRDSRLTDNS